MPTQTCCSRCALQGRRDDAACARHRAVLAVTNPDKYHAFVSTTIADEQDGAVTLNHNYQNNHERKHL